MRERKKRMNEVKYIKCSSLDEAIELMKKLTREGKDADFCYEKDGEGGLWVEVREEGE